MIDYSNSSKSPPYGQDNIRVWNISSLCRPDQMIPSWEHIMRYAPFTYENTSLFSICQRAVLLHHTFSASDLFPSGLMCKFFYRSWKMLDPYQNVKHAGTMVSRINLCIFGLVCICSVLWKHWTEASVE